MYQCIDGYDEDDVSNNTDITQVTPKLTANLDWDDFNKLLLRIIKTWMNHGWLQVDWQ